MPPPSAMSPQNPQWTAAPPEIGAIAALPRPASGLLFDLGENGRLLIFRVDQGRHAEQTGHAFGVSSLINANLARDAARGRPQSRGSALSRVTLLAVA